MILFCDKTDMKSCVSSSCPIKHFFYYNHVGGLLPEMRLTSYVSDEWRIFIESSKRSLKCVLLYIGTNLDRFSIGHLVYLKEEY